MVATLPKRLCEALVGAAAQRTLPRATLWAPTFHPRDGFGERRQELLGSLLLQCSPAYLRVSGPSTRVSRAQLAAYRDRRTLAPWKHQVRFVLAGAEAAGAQPPWTYETPTDRSGLYVIGVDDLAVLVDRQQRGTISADTLAELSMTPSAHVPGLCVRPLEDDLRAGVARHLDARRVEALDPVVEHGAEWPYGRFIWWRFGPSPIAVSFDRASRFPTVGGDGPSGELDPRN